jgi:hypothetical protein
MVFVPHRKHTYGPPQPVKWIVFVLLNILNMFMFCMYYLSGNGSISYNSRDNALESRPPVHELSGKPWFLRQSCSDEALVPGAVVTAVRVPSAGVRDANTPQRLRLLFPHPPAHPTGSDDSLPVWKLITPVLISLRTSSFPTILLPLPVPSRRRGN